MSLDHIVVPIVSKAKEIANILKGQCHEQLLLVPLELPQSDFDFSNFGGNIHI